MHGIVKGGREIPVLVFKFGHHPPFALSEANGKQLKISASIHRFNKTTDTVRCSTIFMLILKAALSAIWNNFILLVNFSDKVNESYYIVKLKHTI